MGSTAMPPAFIVSSAECGMDKADALLVSETSAVAPARSEQADVEEKLMVPGSAGVELRS